MSLSYRLKKVCNLILEASVINCLSCFAYISPTMFTNVRESHPGRFIITSSFVCQYFCYFKVISYFINHLFHAPLYSLALAHLIEAEGMRSFKDSFSFHAMLSRSLRTLSPSLALALPFYAQLCIHITRKLKDECQINASTA